MALFDKIKKPDFSKIGQNLKNVSDSVGNAIGNTVSDIAQSTVNGVGVASDAVGHAFSVAGEKLHEVDVQAALSKIDLSKITDGVADFGDKFSESSFWQKIKDVASKIGGTVTYNLMLLLEMAKSDEVPIKDKALIVGALGYFIFPVDAIPDVIAGVGYLDDMGSIAFVLGKIQESITPKIRLKARTATENLFGKSEEEWFLDPEEAYDEAKKDTDKALSVYHSVAKATKKRKKR